MDLYVLERAFASTHPDSEPLYTGVLDAYEKRMGKHWPPIKRRLDDGGLSPLHDRVFVLTAVSPITREKTEHGGIDLLQICELIQAQIKICDEMFCSRFGKQRLVQSLLHNLNHCIYLRP